MNKLINDLRYPVSLFASVPSKNEIGEDCLKPKHIKNLWASIVPISGKNTVLPGNVEGTEITHRFVVRAEAMPTALPEMYFNYKGDKYWVKYIYPHFKQHDRFEVYCRLEVC